MNLHSCRTYIRKRTVLNTTATTLDTVAKPACSLNHIPKSPYYQSLTDPIKTAIERGLSLASAAGEDVLIFKADQQLYKGTVDVLSASLRNTLDACINHSNDDKHSEGALMNIVTGQIAHPD